LSKLSVHLDNSKYFLGKRNLWLISLNKYNIKDNNNNGNKKENGINEEKKRKKV
jgi:hypothetical protein